MSKRTPKPTHDKLAMFRDPPSGETYTQDEFTFHFEQVEAKPLSPEERQEQIRVQLAPCVEPRICGALTRKGTACFCKKLYKNGRCKFHGGLSTGPKTAKGKARVALNLRNVRRRPQGPGPR